LKANQRRFQTEDSKIFRKLKFIFHFKKYHFTIDTENTFRIVLVASSASGMAALAMNNEFRRLTSND
jgi:mevalonate pyrophosphate decarboxylase